jgi:hypothetical protein
MKKIIYQNKEYTVAASFVDYLLIYEGEEKKKVFKVDIADVKPVKPTKK